ncbi:MAG: hypothetical protein WDN49_11515 [Acetobacteraceae bacterium]
METLMFYEGDARRREMGIGLIAIHSAPFRALSLDVEPFAAEGLVTLSMVNSAVCVVPHRVRRPVYRALDQGPAAGLGRQRATRRNSSTAIKGHRLL